MADAAGTKQAFFDLHCHTSFSFDSLARPRDQVQAAARRGLTHLAITDHDTIDGALEGRDQAPAGLTVIIGEEVKTADGDLICIFLERALEPGRPAAETIAAARAQGGLVGIPHPFDRHRNSMLRDTRLETLVPLVDWVEAWNARVIGRDANEQAALFAREHGLPGLAASDAHSSLEVGVAYNSARYDPTTGHDPATAGGLRSLLGRHEMHTGRASYYVRGLTPIAKALTRFRARGTDRTGETR